MATSPAGRMLSRQLQQMQSDKDIPGISCGLVDNNVFEWEVMLMISDDVKLYGGMVGCGPDSAAIPAPFCRGRDPVKSLECDLRFEKQAVLLIFVF